MASMIGAGGNNAQDGELSPLLDYEIIASSITEVTKGTIKVSIDDLKKPEPEKIRSVYIGLACAIMNIAAENIVQAQLPSLEDLMYPTILDDSIALANTALVLNRLLSACTINDFSLKDIIVPKPKRTHRMLSALVNFLRYTWSRKHVEQDAVEMGEKMKEETETMLHRRDELRSKIEAIKARKAQEYEELKQVNPIVDRLRTTNDKLNRQQEHDNKILENITADVKLKADVVAERTERVGKWLPVTERACIQISSAREEDISKVGKEMKSCEEVIQDKKALLNQWSLQDIGLKQLEEDAHVALKIITNLKLVLEKQREAESTLEEVKDRVVSQEQRFKDFTATLQNKRRQTNSKYEKLTRLSLQHEKRLSAIHETVEVEAMRRAQLEKDVKEKWDVRRQQLIEEEQELLELDKLQGQVHRERIDKVKSNFEQILEQLDVYHRSLTKGWQEIAPYYDIRSSK